MTTQEMRRAIQYIISSLRLSLHPQAVKMLETDAGVPENALRPKSDKGRHMALCQALALTKREGKTVWFTKEDHWCWNPLIGLGHVACEPGTPAFEEVARNLGIDDLDKARDFFAAFPKLEPGKYAGMLISPAETADFEPDVILVNCDDNFQLRTLIWAVKNQTGKMLSSDFDAIDSCIHSIVTPIKTGNYAITIPDPGDQERALTPGNEIILSVPISRLAEITAGLKEIDGRGVGYRGMKPIMQYDFARPPFYNELFRLWDLDQGENWEH